MSRGKERSKLQTVVGIVNSASKFAGFWDHDFRKKVEFCSAFYVLDPMKDLTEPELVRFAIKLIPSVQEKLGNFEWNSRRLHRLQGYTFPKPFTKKARPKNIHKNGNFPSQQEIRDFYLSWEWKRVRYDFLKDRSRRCGCCGATPESGNKIVVDHIRPIRHNWHLRLDPTNLQCLCDDCNMGKGSRDETDWRANRL